MKTDLKFGILLFLLGQVLAGRESIMTISKMESWISAANFTTMIRKSLFYSKCCNIYLSESIHTVEALFNQFRTIYPYDYLLRRKIYACQGYLLLGRTDKEIEKIMPKVPSSISTTEILIIVNELENNSTLFNVSLYKNSNANIVSRSGIWTLSENYLEPRVFHKVNSYEELMHEFDTVNLKGRELQVCTFYRPPVSYLKTTVKKIINGVEEEVFLVDNDMERDGIEMKIFLLIAKKLNFTWTIRKPNGDYRYGRRNGSQWNGGVIQLLREKKIDMAFASIWLTQDHYLFANLSVPWYEMFIQFLVPRPQPITSFWALTRPFSLHIWLLLLFMLILKSLYMYVRAKIDPKFPKRFRSFLSTITELMGRLLGTWVPRNTVNARVELHLWQTVGFVLVTAYCSSLAARLASWEYEDRIDTVRQFLDANLSWGRTGKVPPFHDYFDLNNPDSKQLPLRYIPLKDVNETHKLIKKGKYALFGIVMRSMFFPEDEVSNEDLKNYRVMKQKVGNYYTSFAVQPWLLRPVNTIILWMRETGIIHFHLSDVIRRRANFNLHEVLMEHDGLDGTARVLKLMPLGAGFAIFIVGLLISIITFIYELRQAASSRSIYEVFRDIQEKRKIRKQSARKRNCQKEIEFKGHSLSNNNFNLLVNIQQVLNLQDNGN